MIALVFLLTTPRHMSPANREEVLHFTFLSNGVKSGEEVDQFSDGKVKVAYEFNDRGRGPKVSGFYRLDKGGLPTEVSLKGVDYYKAPVDEHFWISGGRAHWKSTTEHGDSKPGGFYLSLNPAIAETGFLASALLKSGHPIDLYPGGQASIQKLMETTVVSGSKKQHVTEYALTGISLAPTFVWLDDNNRFFAAPSDWTAILRTGWENTNKQLFDLQNKSTDEWYEHVASDISQHPQHAVAFTHVNLFDSENAASEADETVVVEGKTITAVGPSAQVTVPPDAEIIDGTGKTLLPGLFDMHVHLGASDGPLHIASGVTSVRDMGNSIDTLAKLQKAWDAGTQIGPHIYKAGLIDGRGPYQCPTGLYASTLDEALADANKYIDNGFIQIKIYSSLNPDFVPPLVKLAHSRGVRVSGHVPQGLFATEFVNDGVDEIQHMNFIMLNFLRDKVKDTRTPERFTAVAQYGAGIDQNSTEVKNFIQLLLDHHVTVDATAGAFEGMFCARPGVVDPSMAPVLERMPVQFQRSAMAGGLPTTASTDQVYKDSFAAMLSFLGKLYNAGVPILAGTDGLAGVMLHRELELEVQAGIPSKKALQIATWNAARLLKVDNQVGSVAVGKKADLYLVEGDPTANISDIRRSRIVMKDGVMFSCDKLYAASGMGPAK